MGNALKDGVCVACHVTPLIEIEDGKFHLPLCSSCKDKMIAKARMLRVSGSDRKFKGKIRGGYKPRTVEVDENGQPRP